MRKPLYILRGMTNRMLKAGLRAALYLRASTDEQSLTLDEQRAQLQALAAQHSLLAIAAFQDDESGTRRPGLPINKRTGLPSTHKRAKVRRPGLVALLDAVRLRQIDAVLFTDLSRLARRVSLQADLLDAFMRAGVLVLTVEGRIDLRRASDRLVHNIKGSVAEHYADYVGERTKAVIHRLRAQGRKYTRIAPYGFRVVPSDVFEKGVLAPDPHEQNVLKLIARLSAKGVSLRDVAAELNARGYRTRAGTEWHFAYVHNQLRRMQRAESEVA